MAAAATEAPPDPLPLITSLSEAAGTAAGRQAGLTAELAAQYLLAFHGLPAAHARQQLSAVQLFLGQRQLGGVVALVQGAIEQSRFKEQSRRN